MGKIFRALEKSEQGLQHDTEKSAENDFPGQAYSSQSQADQPHSDQADSDTVHDDTENKGTKHFTQEHKTDSFETEHTLPTNVNEALVSLLKPHSPASEQIRLLKTNLLFPEKGEPPRTIMITSASSGDGKSFVSANLAVSIAQSIDEFVLLMDCDLRHPTVHSLFGFDMAHKGLSEYLSSTMPLSSVLKKTFINKLTILPGGRIPSNPLELLSSEQMRRLLHEVKLRYSDRYILIDTPPPYITSETNAIARYVDGIIIVVRYGKTRKKEVQDIIDIYGKDKILGVVQNYVKKKIGYGYGYHKYGYGYGKQ